LRTAHERRGARGYWTSWGYVAFRQDRERQVLRLLRRHHRLPLGERTVLDVGCGTGAWIRDLIRWGARPERITGVDLLAEDLARARELVPAGVRLEVGNAASLPFPAGSFDLVVQATVMSSVLDPVLRRAIAAELLRVVAPDGVVLWYDLFRASPKNPDVRPVTRREIRALFAGCRLELKRVTLAPPLARGLAPHAWILTMALAGIPWLCTHYLGTITRPTATP
jgi:SAM-dependent methyltransferase